MGACHSKKAFKAALKKRRMEKLPKGQRNSSSGGGAPLPKRPPTNLHSSPAPSNGGTPKQSPAPSSGSGGGTKGRKALKSSVRDTGNRKPLPPRGKPSSASTASSTNSPASLHGRVLQKTSTVSPAPIKAPLSSSTPLTRFGFKSSPLITSGESTDSVNSILSDAQTTSDSNSNIFFLSEENGNDASDLISSSHARTDPKDSSNVNLRTASPCTISQASSGVTSTLLNGKLKAQTKQLPIPQVVTVKTMNSGSKNTSPTITSKPRFSSPVSRKERSPQRSPLGPKTSKIPLNSHKNSLPKTQRVSRDSESSTKSLGTADSGIGSSSESDKLRSLDSLPFKGKDKPGTKMEEVKDEAKMEEGKDETKENGFDLDVSDAWLKQRHEQQEQKRKSCDLDLKFKENVQPQNNSKSCLPEKLPPKESFKDKRDSNITYGMARQKFAPYNRNRLTYLSASSKSPSPIGTKPLKKDPNVKLSDCGTVRTRIAQLEKTPLTTPAEQPAPQNPPKKPVARPTSIEKTPILVSSKTENTVELSRSICRRLEYSEGKSALLDSLMKDDKSEGNFIELPSTAQDLLMVDSFEVKKELSLKDEENSLSIKLPNKNDVDIHNESSECKRIKDISECENSTKRLPRDTSAEAGKGSSLLSEPLQLHLPEDSTKLFSPDGSEVSFEVLECRSADLSPKEGTDSSAREADGFVTQLMSGFAISTPESCAKHSQNSPSRVTPLKKCRQDSNCDETVLKFQDDKCVRETPDRLDSPIRKGVLNMNASQTSQNDSLASSVSGSKGVMESSVESNRSGDINRMSGSVEANRMSDSGDRWTVSGKCTPTLSSTRGDADQDFLIDDEISDQPGLTFGDELEESFFGDEDLFSDISSPSVSHLIPKTDRSRHGSMGTTSSIGGDDLMLDYDLEEPKQLGYGEEVLSPVACEILNEWSALLNDAQPTARSSSHSCVSQPNIGVNAGASNVLGPSLSSSPNTDINTHQPLSNCKDYSELPTLSRSGSFTNRSRTASAGPDFCTGDIKKGVNFKPPRQGLSSEHDGGVSLDRTTLHYICQDVTAMKTLLLRLRRVIQVADTINPFDVNHKTSLYLSLGANESPEREEPNSTQDVVQQNVDLKRQVVLLQQRLEEKDRTIRILQQQLSQALQQSTSPSIHPNTTDSRLTVSSSSSAGGDSIASSSSTVSNAATQTERFGHRSSPFTLASMSRTSSVEDGLGPTVSSENAKSLLNEHPHLTPSPEKESKRDCSPRKRFPSEFLVAPSSKLSLAPATPVVMDSLAS